jgi:drug/metabolite transporter (DMT)-like permease
MAGRSRLAGAIALGGALGPVLMLVGLARAGAAEVSLWLNLEAVFTAALGALFFRDPLSRLGWLGATGVIAACALLFVGGDAAGFVAATWIAAACICWALDNHWTALLGDLSPAAITLWKGAVAGSLNLTLGLALAPWQAEFGAVCAALATGAICYGASISLYVASAQALGATRAQLVFASAPFFGVALAVGLLGEPFGARELAAAVVMAGSLALVLRGQHLHLHRHEPAAHVHWHRHDDGHHAHAHQPDAAASFHAHWHEHEPLAHAHAHHPDLHHRHAHMKEP